MYDGDENTSTTWSENWYVAHNYGHDHKIMNTESCCQYDLLTDSSKLVIMTIGLYIMSTWVQCR